MFITGTQLLLKKDGTVIGHLPRKVSRVGSLLLKRGGSIHCTVRGSEDALLTYHNVGAFQLANYSLLNKYCVFNFRG